MKTQKEQGMRTQVRNERLALNGQLGPGALVPGPRTQRHRQLGLKREKNHECESKQNNELDSKKNNEQN